MFEHTDEQAEKRELMRVLARAVLKIDEGKVGTVTDAHVIEKARDGIVKLLGMLKGKTAATPAAASAELRKICELVGARVFQYEQGSAQEDLVSADSLLTGLRRTR